MTLSARVRAATFEDLVDIHELQLELRTHHAQLEPDNPRYQIDEKEWLALIQRDLRADRCLFLIAEADRKPCGFVKLEIVEKPWGRACEMDTLVVAAQARGQGIGALLVDAAEEQARSLGALAMRANVLVSNLRGREFYESSGYAEIAVRFGKPL